jgi:hypothetical protein
VKGLGRRDYYVSVEDYQHLMEYLHVSKIIWAIAVACAKVAVALTLLRLKDGRLWTWTLWLGIVIQVASAVTGSVFLLAGCRPIRAYWAPVPPYQCWAPTHFRIFSIIYAGRP